MGDKDVVEVEPLNLLTDTGLRSILPQVQQLRHNEQLSLELPGSPCRQPRYAEKTVSLTWAGGHRVAGQVYYGDTGLEDKLPSDTLANRGTLSAGWAWWKTRQNWQDVRLS